MKIEYRKLTDNESDPWLLLTNIDELIWNGVYALRVLDDDGSLGLPFLFEENDTVTLVLKDHAHDGKLQYNRTVVQTITRVERSTGKVLTYNRTRYCVDGKHSWSGWEQSEEKNDASAMVSVVQQIEKNLDAEITRATETERLLGERIDNLPQGGSGEIADDTLFVNDGVICKIGAFKSLEEDIYEGTNYRAYTNHILENGETITLSKGYKFSAVRRYLSQDDRLATAKEIEDTAVTLQSAKGITYTMFEIVKEDNTAFTKDELPKIIKSFKRNGYEWESSSDLNNFVAQGMYNISGERTADANDNMPIHNAGKVEARLNVLVGGNCITQVLTLLNVAGGDGNVYTRTRQDGVWEQWGKLQTNIEVGQVNSLDNLTDNGIYSGVFTDGSTTAVGSFYDTFILVVINNYSVSGVLGQLQSISQLSYSLKLDGSVSLQTRVKQGDSWSEWRNIGG